MTDNINPNTACVAYTPEHAYFENEYIVKELTERGLRTLVIERGRDVRQGQDYMDQLAPWELPGRDLAPARYEDTGQYARARRKGWVFRASYLPFLVDDKAYPYSYPEDRVFMWTRGYQTGGRSLTWGRQTYRWGPKEGTMWETTWNLVQSHLGYVSVKDFRWVGRTPEASPLGAGQVSPEMLAGIRHDDHGDFSLHVEYLEQDGAQANRAALASDVRTLRRMLASPAAKPRAARA